MKTNYTQTELNEFEELIVRKLEKAKEEYLLFLKELQNERDGVGVNLKLFEDGALSNQREEESIHAARQKKLIGHLEAALVRVRNKSYGICRATGKLIPKERLIAVPHATLSIEAKNKQY